MQADLLWHSRHGAALACEVLVDVILRHVEQLAVFAGDAVTHCLQFLILLALVQHSTDLHCLERCLWTSAISAPQRLTYLCACGCSLICQEAALQSRSTPSMA